MDRRTFIGSVVGGLLAAPLAAEEQQAGKVYRIGYLSTPTREFVAHGVDAFLQKSGEFGWVDGKSLIIEYRWAEGNVERLPDLAADLVRRKVDVIVAPAGSAALAAKAATSSTPIVMIFPSDPIEIGLVASLSRPGGTSQARPSRPIRRFLASSCKFSTRPSRAPHGWRSSRTRQIHHLHFK